MISYRPLSPGFGYLVHGGADDDLFAVDRNELLSRLVAPEGGALLFRGFRSDEAAFRRFTELHGTRFVVHHDLSFRDYVNDDLTFATVHLGQHAVDFHNEMAANPASPDLFWMYCVRPPARGGRTGLADGAKVLEGLTSSARALFEEFGHRYVYSNVTPEYWLSALPWISNRTEAEQWLRTTGAEAGITRFEFDDQDRLTFELRRSPIRIGKFCQRPVFVSGMLDSPDTPLGDKPMPNYLRTEVSQAIYRDVVWIDWHPGDIVWLDNTRVMHAREAFDDPHRRILVRYSALRE